MDDYYRRKSEGKSAYISKLRQCFAAVIDEYKVFCLYADREMTRNFSPDVKKDQKVRILRLHLKIKME